MLPPASPPLCPPPSRTKTETFGKQEFAEADGVLRMHVTTNVGVTVVYKSQISEWEAAANLDRTTSCDAGISIQILVHSNQVVRMQPPQEGKNICVIV